MLISWRVYFGRCPTYFFLPEKKTQPCLPREAELLVFFARKLTKHQGSRVPQAVVFAPKLEGS